VDFLDGTAKSSRLENAFLRDLPHVHGPVKHTPVADMSSDCEDMFARCGNGIRRALAGVPVRDHDRITERGGGTMRDAQKYRVCTSCGAEWTANQTTCDHCGQLTTLKSAPATGLHRAEPASGRPLERL
jgi:hypothetical protein